MLKPEPQRDDENFKKLEYFHRGLSCKKTQEKSFFKR